MTHTPKKPHPTAETSDNSRRTPLQLLLSTTRSTFLWLGVLVALVAVVGLPLAAIAYP